MRPWRVRLALRRSRIQWALLSVVLLVSVLASTLLATLYLLSDATETFAARAALVDAPAEDIRMVQRVQPDGPLDEVIDSSVDAAGEFFGEIPFSTQIHAESGLMGFPREDEDLDLGFLSSIDGVDDYITIVQGEPLPAQSSNRVLVPIDLYEDHKLEVGATIDVAPVFQSDNVTTMTVVGVYRVKEPETDFWRWDRLQGRAYTDAMPVPFSGGRIVTDGYGPLLTDIDTVGDFPVDTVNLEYLPDFSTVSLAQAQQLMDRVDTVERATVGSIGAIGDNVRVLTFVDDTLGRVIGSLAVTRSSVLVTGLLLLVLSVAALAQTARLISERRHVEQALMIARGSSGRQLIRLALIESIVLAGITVAVSPYLANAAYQVLARQDAMARAGMDQDPGIPALTWAVVGAVGILLILVLVAPLMRRASTFVEAESARSRPGKRAAFQRSGIDIALVALAGLAYWQLRSYESPVIADGGVARLDPLLAAGPALALLAGSLVAVRLIPAASRLLEGLAARGRRAVMPLAAWEVGRRSARAISAILLLTLAVSIGTFALAYLSTWRTSQDDQAQFRHPVDAVVSGVPGPALAQASIVNQPSLDATGTPTVNSDSVVTTRLDDGFNRGDSLSGRDVTLLATTDDGLAAFAEGRAGAEGAAAIPAALAENAAAADTRDPIVLPDTSAALAMDVTLDTSATVLPGIRATVRAVLEDADGLRSTVEMGVAPADGETLTLQAPIVPTASAADLAQPLSLVGVQVSWFTTEGQDIDASELTAEGALALTLSIDNIAGLELGRGIPIEGEDPLYTAVPAEVDLSQPWFAHETFVNARSLTPDGDQLHAELLTAGNPLRFRPASLSLTVDPAVGDVPLVLTRSIASTLSVDEGARVRFDVDGTILFGVVTDIVRSLPSDDARAGVLVARLDVLQNALVQAGVPVDEPDEWWVTVPDENVDAYATAVGDDGQVTSRIGLATSLKEDPLRVATQAALWLVTGAAVILAALGFAVHSVVTVRAREVEFAQLRAVGIARRQLGRVVSVESALLTLLGVAFGLALGLALAYLVAPLVSVGADGRPPIPDVTVVVPWITVGLLALEAAAVLLVTVLIVNLLLRRIDPARTLRLGE